MTDTQQAQANPYPLQQPLTGQGAVPLQHSDAMADVSSMPVTLAPEALTSPPAELPGRLDPYLGMIERAARDPTIDSLSSRA